MQGMADVQAPTPPRHADRRPLNSAASTGFFDDGAQHTTALNSLNYVHFFARENNCFMLGAETAQALPNANLWYAVIRGAGKQYGLLWFGNASVYNRFSWKSHDTESPKLDKEGYSYGPNAGTSLSLLRRLIYVEYLYNSDMLGYESGLITTKENMEKVEAGVPLEPNATDSDKSLFTGDDAVLSPIGQASGRLHPVREAARLRGPDVHARGHGAQQRQRLVHAAPSLHPERLPLMGSGALRHGRPSAPRRVLHALSRL